MTILSQINRAAQAVAHVAQTGFHKVGNLAGRSVNAVSNLPVYMQTNRAVNFSVLAVSQVVFNTIGNSFANLVAPEKTTIETSENEDEILAQRLLSYVVLGGVVTAGTFTLRHFTGSPASKWVVAAFTAGALAIRYLSNSQTVEDANLKRKAKKAQDTVINEQENQEQIPLDAEDEKLEIDQKAAEDIAKAQQNAEDVKKAADETAAKATEDALNKAQEKKDNVDEQEAKDLAKSEKKELEAEETLVKVEAKIEANNLEKSKGATLNIYKKFGINIEDGIAESTASEVQAIDQEATEKKEEVIEDAKEQIKSVEQTEEIVTEVVEAATDAEKKEIQEVVNTTIENLEEQKQEQVA